MNDRCGSYYEPLQNPAYRSALAHHSLIARISVRLLLQAAFAALSVANL